MTAPRRASRCRWRSATTVGSKTACSRSREIPSLDQPAPDDIVLDRWLTVPGNPTTLEFNGQVDHLGFLSASYPQPELDECGVAQVPVDYYRQDDIPWLRELPVNNWVAISFDRFWPPERESVEYIAQIGNCEPPHD